MRASRTIVLAAALLIALTQAPVTAALIGEVAAPAITPAPLALELNAAQQPPRDLNIDIDINRRGDAWWTSPVWIAIGVIAAILLVLIVAMAMRGGGTTVVKS